MSASNSIPGALEELGGGRYRLLGRLDRGGMATVYRGYDTRLEIERAIKVLLPDLADRRGARRRFDAEARTMARLHHPNIITVHDVGTEGPLVYIVMELAEGGNLRERVRRLGPIPPRLAVRATTAILNALEAAHGASVVHRDIKPQNVLMTAGGTVKVTDFGIAHVETHDAGMTHTGAILGTWSYMAPEQRTNAREVDATADIYSVGATLYYLLTGVDPLDLYVAEDAATRLAFLPEALRDVVGRATRYKPVDRYASAVEMRAALEACLARLPEDPPDTPPLASVGAAATSGETMAPAGSMMMSEDEPESAAPWPSLPSDRGASSEGTPWLATPPPRREANARPDVVLSPETQAAGTSWTDAPPVVAVDVPASEEPAGWPRGVVIGLGVAALAVIAFVVWSEASPPSPAVAVEEKVEVPPPVVEGASQASAVPPPPTAAEVAAPSVAPVPPVAAAATPTPRAQAAAPRAPRTPEAAAPAAAAASGTGTLYVMSKPWSDLVVDGQAKGTTGWSGPISAGAHQLRLTTGDGRVHTATVVVSPDDSTRICWDFDASAACSR
jgi:serine/threonine protein kinase